MFALDGRVAIVTGSSRGIGRASALALARAGARVVVSSRKAEACAAAAAEIEAACGAGSATAIPASISDKAQLEALVAQTRARLGEIDILVCNAASNPYFGPMAGIADDQFRKILDNNILSSHWLIGMVAPAMAARGGGSVVIVSSIGGMLASTAIGAYNISKAADMQLARNLAAEHGPAGIRVNCVAPGLVRTDFARALWSDADRLAAFEEAVPLRRIGEPEDIAGAIVFLASDASRYLTGQTIVVDGGATIVTSGF